MEKGRVGNHDFNMIVVGFVLGSALLLPPGQLAQNNAWAATLLGMIEGIGVSLVYCTLARRFARRTLPQIATLVWGRYLGMVVSLLYLWFLVHLASLVMNNFVDFVSVLLLPRTPQEVIIGILIVAVAAVATHGLKVLGYCSDILVPVVLVVLVVTVILLMPDIKLSRLLPILRVPLTKLIYASHAAASFPFNEAVAFMMVFPSLEGEVRPSTMVKPLLIAGAFLCLSSIRNIGVMGPLVGDSVYPSYHALRLIDLARFFTRLESLGALAFLAVSFIKISVLLYGASLGLAQLLKLCTHRTVVFPLAILIAIVSSLNFANIGQNMAGAQWGWPVYAPIFQIAIPLATLVCAVVTGKREKGKTR